MEKKEKIYLGCFLGLILIFIYIFSRGGFNDKNNDIIIENPTEKIEDVNFIHVEIAGAVRRTGLFYVPEIFRINDLIVFAGGVTEEADLSSVNLSRKVVANEKVIIPTTSIFDNPDENSCSRNSNDICVIISGAIRYPATYVVKKGITVGELIFKAGGVTEEVDVLALEVIKNLVLNENKGLIIKSKDSENIKLVNINLASLEELLTLHNIGKVTAANIIAYREEHGFFKTIEEIMNVTGIGKITFDSIKDFITI
ncbi:MAG: SLBB domain-containing protein [Erysipelotrichales bacterium]|nr:SLBB domain-containing protein [Erysipelotrichales bacterium]